MYGTPRSNRSYTVEDYERLQNDPRYRTELSRGLLVREPQPGAIHGEVTTRIFRAIDTFAQSNGLGRVTCQTGFCLDPLAKTVRAPDVAFVRGERVPAEPPSSFWPFAPDLAVEVVSPSNSLSDMHQKVIDYFEAGTAEVWLLDPRTRTVMVYRSLNDIRLLRDGDHLSGRDLLPGFTYPISAPFGW